jgi:hypothetical protein
MLVLSNAYQMSSDVSPETRKIDPDNNLLSRWRLRRLEAEIIRDSMLAVSGELNPQQGGPSVYPVLPRPVLEGQSRPGDGWHTSPHRQAHRRSVYIFVKRSLAVPELDLLDSPDTTSSCEQRVVSTTGPQALTFLNGSFAQEQAQALCERLQRNTKSDLNQKVEQAFELALCRPARPDELRTAAAFVKKGPMNAPASVAALKAFCLVLMNTNEFVYLN